MTTTWNPFFRPEPHVVLCKDGTVLQEPALETTGSQRKVRLRDNPSVSTYTKDLSEFLHKTITEAAGARGSEPWIGLRELDREVANASSDLRRITDADPLLAEDYTDSQSQGYGPIQSNKCHALTLVWEFRHPSLPLRAVVRAEIAEISSQRGTPNSKAYLRLMVWQTNTYPSFSDYSFNTTYPWVANDTNDPFWWPHQAVQTTAHRVLKTDHADLLALFKDPSGLARNPVGGRWIVMPTHRHAYAALFKIANAMEDLDAWPLLDMRESGDGSEVGILPLKPHLTNCTAGLLERLRELANDTGMKELSLSYQNFRNSLARAGLVLSDQSEDNLSAMIAGNQDSFVPVKTADDSPVSTHVLRLDLLSGQFDVGCPHNDADEINALWQEATMVAELTGQTANFKAFIQTFLVEASKRRQEELAKKS